MKQLLRALLFLVALYKRNLVEQCSDITSRGSFVGIDATEKHVDFDRPLEDFFLIDTAPILTGGNLKQ